MQRKLRQTATTDANTTQCEVLTVQETAALLKVPPSSIYEWTRYRGSNRGTSLPHRKVGKYLRFLRSEVESWLLGLPQSTNARKRKYTRKNQANGKSTRQFGKTTSKRVFGKRRKSFNQTVTADYASSWNASTPEERDIAKRKSETRRRLLGTICYSLGGESIRTFAETRA